jgi:hypothetical protein
MDNLNEIFEAVEALSNQLHDLKGNKESYQPHVRYRMVLELYAEIQSHLAIAAVYLKRLENMSVKTNNLVTEFGDDLESLIRMI